MSVIDDIVTGATEEALPVVAVAGLLILAYEYLKNMQSNGALDYSTITSNPITEAGNIVYQKVNSVASTGNWNYLTGQVIYSTAPLTGSQLLSASSGSLTTGGGAVINVTPVGTGSFGGYNQLTPTQLSGISAGTNIVGTSSNPYSAPDGWQGSGYYSFNAGLAYGQNQVVYFNNPISFLYAQSQNGAYITV